MKIGKINFYCYYNGWVCAEKSQTSAKRNQEGKRRLPFSLLWKQMHFKALTIKQTDKKNWTRGFTKPKQSNISGSSTVFNLKEKIPNICFDPLLSSYTHAKLALFTQKYRDINFLKWHLICFKNLNSKC